MTQEDLRRRRFNTLYDVPSETVRDSSLLRKRLARKVVSFLSDYTTASIAHHLEDEFGIHVASPNKKASWELAFANASIGQVLSALTEVPRAMQQSRLKFREADYIREMNRIFQEEYAGYYLDDEFVVHPRPDEAFRADYSFTISKLGSAGLEAAVIEIEKADRHMLEEPQDLGRAIYSVFKACENIFKATTHSQRLAAHFIDSDLEPILAERYAAEPEVVLLFQKEMVGSLKCWMNACHKYRHADGEVLPNQPPEEIAMVAISNGFGFARWLADIYVYQQSRQGDAASNDD